MASNSSDLWSPRNGATTFSSLSDSRTPLSPSRYSYSAYSGVDDSRTLEIGAEFYPDTHRPSSDGDDRSLGHQMRRITVSPTQNSDSDSYTDSNSIDEVEATLNDLDEQFEHTEQALTEWSQGSSSHPSYTSGSYSGTGTFTGTGYTGSPSYVSLPTFSQRSAATPPPDPRMRLSKISERTEESSRPVSGTFSAAGAARPANPTPDAFRRSALLSGTSSHSRMSTDPGLPPPGRTGELIAVFETSSGHARAASTPGETASSPLYSTSYGYSSRPSSPSKTSASYTATDTRPTGLSFLSPVTRPSTSMSGDGTFLSTAPGGTFTRTTGSYITPSYTQSPGTVSHTTRTETDTTFTGTDTPTYTGTDTRTFTTDTRTRADTRTYTNTFTDTSVTPTSTLRRPQQASPRSPLTSVRNIVALWKERTPSIKRPAGRTSAVGSTASVSPLPEVEGLLGRTRMQNGNGREPVTPTREDGSKSAQLPPGLDVADLLPYTQSTEASAPSPTHPSARDDIGTIAAKEQSMERDGQPLMDMLVPFHMFYADGVERLAAESLLERQRWVNRLWESVNRPVVMPDSSSVTRSPTGSIRTILSIDSRSSVTSTGSRSTVYIPPLSSLPSIPDFSSNASLRSSRSDRLTRGTSILSSHHTRTVDDTVISNQEYIYPGDARAIQPARTGSLLRRSGSMADLDAEFALAVSRARDARPGLGFPSLVLGGSPVTVSSGPNLGRNVVVTPPPGGRGSDRARSEMSDEHFFSAGSSTEGSRSASYTPTSYLSEIRTSTGLRSDVTPSSYGYTASGSSMMSGTQIVPSTMSYRGASSASYLGDSHDGSSRSSGSTAPSGTSLSRTREVRRRWPRGSRSYSSGRLTDGSSDKENLSGSLTPDSGTQSMDSRSHLSSSYTPSSATYSQLYSDGTRSYTTSGSGTYTSGSGSYTDSGSYTPNGSYSSRSYSSEELRIRTDSDTATPGESDETGYDICFSSDLNGRLTTSSDETMTPSSSVTPLRREQVSSDVESENYVTASQGSLDYVSARSPSLRGSILSAGGSETSYASFPTIPSDIEFMTPDTGYSHYRTSSEPSLGSEYITAELCPTIPSEQSSPTLSSIKLSSEDGAPEMVHLPPSSAIPSIRSPSLLSDVYPPLPPSESSETSSVHLTPSLPSPPLPPLPESVVSLSPAPISIPSSPELPPLPRSISSRSQTPISQAHSLATESSAATPIQSHYRSPSLDSVTREMSFDSSSVPSVPASVVLSNSAVTPSTLILSSSPTPSEHPSTPAPRLPTVLTVSSPTISSVTSLTNLTPAFSEPPHTPSLSADRTPPPQSPQTWAQETNFSYDSSQLAPSPTVMSLAVPEGHDTSFETSFLRPSGSGVSSVDRMSPIPETPTSLSPATSRSPLPQLTPVPMPPYSISVSTEARTPSPLQRERSSLPSLSSIPTLSSITTSSLVTTPRTFALSSPRLSDVPPLALSEMSSSRVRTPSAFALSEVSLSPRVPMIGPSPVSSGVISTPSELSLSEAFTQVPPSNSARSRSDASFRSQTSLVSSGFRSLVDEEDLETVDADAISTIPSLLTTPSQVERSLSPPSTPRTHLETPEGSIIVSLSTPQGSAQPTQPSLTTVISESVPTERDLSRDIDRIADDLRQYDIARGVENRELADNVQALRDELRDLSDYLHRSPPHPPPPVLPQLVDERVQGNVPISTLAPNDHALSPATSHASIGSYLSSHHSDEDLLDSEPWRNSSPPWHTPTPTYISSDASSRSSPQDVAPSVHSYPYPALPATRLPASLPATPLPATPLPATPLPATPLPATPLPATPLPATPLPATPLPLTPRSVTSLPAAPPLSASPLATSPPPSSSPSDSSPTSSSSSSTPTPRPWRVPTPPDLSGPFNEIRDRLNALWDGQNTTNHLLDTLQDRVPPVDNELQDRLRRIEELLRVREDHSGRGEVHYPQPSLSPVSSGTGLSELEYRIHNFPLPAPVPTRQGPPLIDRLEEILATSVPLATPVIQPPPEHVPIQYTRREVRSISPISIVDLPRRSESAPSLDQVHPPAPRRRPRVRTTPQVVETAPPVHPEPQEPIPSRERVERVEPIQPASVPPTEPEIDVRGGIRANRPIADPQSDRPHRHFPPPRPVIPPLYGSPPRAQTTPAEPIAGPSWYRPRDSNRAGVRLAPDAGRDGPATPVSQDQVPHPSQPQQPQQAPQPPQAPGGQLPYERMPPPPVVVQLPPVFEGMMDLLRQNRDAQAASVQQQRGIMDYMRNLNEWLRRDTDGRLNELQGLNARVDELRDAIQNVRVRVVPPESGRTSPRSVTSSTPSALGPAVPFNRQTPTSPRPPPIMQMPVPQRPEGPVIPEGPFIPPEGPVIPPAQGGYPSGFIPFQPVIPPVVPDVHDPRRRRTPVQPFIPPPPSGIIPAPPIPPIHFPTPGPGPMPVVPPSEPVITPFIPPEEHYQSGSPRRNQDVIYENGTPTSSSSPSTVSTDRSSTLSPVSSRDGMLDDGGRYRTSSSRRPTSISRRSSPSPAPVPVPIPQVFPSPLPVQLEPPIVVQPSHSRSESLHGEPPQSQPPAPIIIQPPPIVSGPQPTFISPFPSNGQPMPVVIRPSPSSSPSSPSSSGSRRRRHHSRSSSRDHRHSPSPQAGVPQQPQPIVVAPSPLQPAVIVQPSPSSSHSPPRSRPRSRSSGSRSPHRVPPGPAEPLYHPPVVPQPVVISRSPRSSRHSDRRSRRSHSRSRSRTPPTQLVLPTQPTMPSQPTVIIPPFTAPQSVPPVAPTVPYSGIPSVVNTHPQGVVYPPDTVPTSVYPPVVAVPPSGQVHVITPRSSGPETPSTRRSTPPVVVQPPQILPIVQPVPPMTTIGTRTGSPRPPPQVPHHVVHRPMAIVRPRRRTIDLIEDAIAVAAGLIPLGEGAGTTFVSTTFVIIVGTGIEVACLATIVVDGRCLVMIMIDLRGPDLDIQIDAIDGQGDGVILRNRRGAIPRTHQAQVAAVADAQSNPTRSPTPAPRRRPIGTPTSENPLIHVISPTTAQSAAHGSPVSVFDVPLPAPQHGPRDHRPSPSEDYEPPLSRRPSQHTDFTRGTTPPHIVPPPSHGTREHVLRDEDGPLPVPGRPTGERSHGEHTTGERTHGERTTDERTTDERTTDERTPVQRPAEISREERSPTPVPHPTSVRSTVRPLPPHRAVTPAHGDFGREEEHIQRLQDAEQLVHNAAQSILGADRDRERDFRLNEEDRDRVFQEGEARRHQEAQEHAGAIWQEFRDRIAALLPPAPVQSPPSPPPPPPPAVDAAVTQTEDVAADRASIHSQAQVHTAVQMLDTIEAERAEFAREREIAAQEREQLMQEVATAHRNQAEAQDARIKELEDELAAVRAELENEKQQRMTIETEQRERESQALQERDEAIRNQLGDITNIVQEHHLACDEKNARMEERWQEKQVRRADKDLKMEALENLVRKLAQDMEESRDLALEAKIARERSPNLHDLIQKLEDQNAAQQAMLEELSKSWREDCARYHEETVARVEETAHQQVEFNIQGYLDEFSKALATEVRMLLGEVGKLREERRGLQHELGQLLVLRSKYGPGGEYDPDWCVYLEAAHRNRFLLPLRKPAPGAPGGPPLDPQPPPPGPPAPEEGPPPAKPGWRKVTPRVPRAKKPKKEAAPPPPPPAPAPQPGPSSHPHMYRGPDPRASWAPWIPDLSQQPAMTPVPPHLLVPPQERSPGLFGPRTPPGSIRQ
ncbi:hypothetical protein C0992_000986 [Termitomyces sp. T32_za158]|nr:hypothetical protein C0992_000986 [Termitomyces sp. T32_za158]